MKKYSYLLTGLLLSGCIAFAQTAAYHVGASYPIGGSAGYDYMTVDSASNKLYVSHGSQVNVMDKNTGDSIGVITTEKDVHGIALVHALGKGYVTNGSLNKVLVFDLATNKVLRYVPAGNFADGIFYDDYSKKVISCNGRSKNMTVIDPTADTVFTTIQLTGWPETATSDGKGYIYVNNAEKAEIDVIDATTFKIVHNWPNKPGSGASGLAMDRENMLLFATCENKMMVIMDATTGNIVATEPTGDGADGAGFDHNLKAAYSANGESATLTVIRELPGGKFDVQSVPTKPGARTIAVDPITHKIYLPSAEFKPASKDSFRPQIIPGTFKILVVQKS